MMCCAKEPRLHRSHPAHVCARAAPNRSHRHILQFIQIDRADRMDVGMHLPTDQGCSSTVKQDRRVHTRGACVRVSFPRRRAVRVLARKIDALLFREALSLYLSRSLFSQPFFSPRKRLFSFRIWHSLNLPVICGKTTNRALRKRITPPPKCEVNALVPGTVPRLVVTLPCPRARTRARARGGGVGDRGRQGVE